MLLVKRREPGYEDKALQLLSEEPSFFTALQSPNQVFEGQANAGLPG